jgi:hypothetical protein
MTRITVDEIYEGRVMWTWTLYAKPRWRRMLTWVFRHGTRPTR